jgi:hypothetical protein
VIVAVVSAMASWAGAFVAFRNARTSRRMLQLAEQQESRRQPATVLYLADGFVHWESDARVYAFLLSISNPSDSNNAIARLDLRINYRTPTNYLAAVDVPAVLDREVGFGGPLQNRLELPIRIDAHQTVAGWSYFRFSRGLLEFCEVDLYTVVATDSQGSRQTVETVIVQELIDEVQVQTG